MTDADFQKLRDALVYASKKADLGNYIEAYQILSAKVILHLEKVQSEEEHKDEWADRMSAEFDAREAAREQPSYQ